MALEKRCVEQKSVPHNFSCFISTVLDHSDLGWSLKWEAGGWPKVSLCKDFRIRKLEENYEIKMYCFYTTFVAMSTQKYFVITNGQMKKTVRFFDCVFPQQKRTQS